MNERLYQLALELIPGIGAKTAKYLIAYCGSASAVFDHKQARLAKIPGVGPNLIQTLRSSQSALQEAENILERCVKAAIDIHHYTDPTYPGKLKQVVDAPNIIYTQGHLPKWNRVLAIVGTRNATDYGKSVTEKIVADCESLRPVIVSGLAYGIDITSHRAAIRHQLPTVAVLAGGLDKVYPKIHFKTSQEIQLNGGLISEHPPGIEPEAHHFPARNRIIAGLSDAVIVVEAARKGGALITANIADSYDRTVFAIPGNLQNTYSEGCNYLIRNQKALIYTGAADLCYHLNWDQDLDKPTPLPVAFEEETHRQIYQVLITHPNGIAIDELAWKSQLPINQVASILLALEFQGLIKNLPGKKFQLK